MNYYDEFGISHTASDPEIRASYKKLVRSVHPDHCQDPNLRALAELQTRRLNGILTILLDPSERRHYDASLTGNLVHPRTRKSVKPWYWLAIALLIAICFLPRGRQETAPVTTPGSPPVQPSNTVKFQAPASKPHPQPLAGPIPFDRPTVVPEPALVTLPAPAIAIPPIEPEVLPPPSIAPEKPLKNLAGDWLFIPSSKTDGRDVYPPEYIDLRLNQNGGVLRGRYRARYRIGDRAISPTVAFQFAGPAEPDRAVLPWRGDGGASGEIELRLQADGALDVTWIARSLGTELGLISGTARLVRKGE